MMTKQYLYTSLLVFVFQVENYFQRKTNDFPQSNEKHFKLLFGKHPKHEKKIFSEPILRAKIENMIPPDYVLC